MSGTVSSRDVEALEARDASGEVRPQQHDLNTVPSYVSGQCGSLSCRSSYHALTPGLELTRLGNQIICQYCQCESLRADCGRRPGLQGRVEEISLVCLLLGQAEGDARDGGVQAEGRGGCGGQARKESTVQFRASSQRCILKVAEPTGRNIQRGGTAGRERILSPSVLRN